MLSRELVCSPVRVTHRIAAGESIVEFSALSAARSCAAVWLCTSPRLSGTAADSAAGWSAGGSGAGGENPVGSLQRAPQ